MIETLTSFIFLVSYVSTQPLNASLSYFQLFPAYGSNSGSTFSHLTEY